MIKTTYFIRMTISMLCIVIMAGVSFAGEGDDDDKDKNGKGNTIESVSIDSIDFSDIDIDYIQVDDTLVNEEDAWDDLNDDDGSGSSSSLNIVTDNNGGTFNSSRDDANSAASKLNGSDIIDAFIHRSKEYIVDFTLFPNPTVDQIHIKPSVIPSSIRIADITGKEYISSEYNPKVDVAHLPMGTYLIQLVYHDHIETRRFIKN